MEFFKEGYNDGKVIMMEKVIMMIRKTMMLLAGCVLGCNILI